MTKKEAEPHIKKGSKLDRILDKGNLTDDDIAFAFRELSAIENPSPKEESYLIIMKKLMPKEAPNEQD